MNKNHMAQTLLSIVLIFASSLYLKAQPNQTNLLTNSTVGLSLTGFGEGDFIYFQPIAGGSSTDVDHFVAIGIDLFKPLNKSLFVESGLNLSYQRATVIPNLPPNWDVSVKPETFILLDVPVYLRQHFLKFFFINGGILFDLDPNLGGNYDNQTGIGFGAGLGIQHTFTSGLGFYLSPYFKVHSALPILSGKYHQRYIENSVKIGLTYRL